MVKKQHGMTLVEVLATLIISSLILTLIWTTVNISMRYSLTETKKMHMQQTANYIITDLQKIHRTKECYEIKKNDDFWFSYDCVMNEIITSYDDDQYTIILSGQPTEEIRTDFKNESGNPGKYKDSYDLKIIISDKTKKKLSLEIPTKIYRINESNKREGE